MRPTPARTPQPEQLSIADFPAASLALLLESIEALGRPLNDMATMKECGTLPPEREEKLNGEVRIGARGVLGRSMLQDLALMR